MPGDHRCPTCQSVLTASAPEGLCPKCLWAELMNPESDTADDPGTEPPTAQASIRFGDYELVREIARGGMGVVYQARHLRLQRLVALKMVLTTRLPGETHAKRFRAEAEAIASLEHPHIVPIYEVGEADGRPYFTMKYISGGSLADQLRQTQSRSTSETKQSSAWCDSRAIATLIIKIARAIHHAHQRGILHRDLKPSNILLDELREPLVTDFGLAKQLEQDSELTLTGAVLGTPAYAAPEQAAGNKTLTTSVDVYSLGAIFYELLTGRAPFQADTPLLILRQVIEQEPPRPSTLNPQITRDLETICLKCLQKNPAQRYASAEALAEDLERWSRQEPIVARPVTWPERSWKWARRNPTRAALVLLGILAPAIIIAVLIDTQRTVRHERNLAVAEGKKATVAANQAKAAALEANNVRAQTRQDLYAADMLLAQHALDEGNLNLARRLVEAHRPTTNDFREATLADPRGFEWRLLWERCQGDRRITLSDHSNPVRSVAFSADGRRLASGDSWGKVKLWDMATRYAYETFQASNEPLLRVTFSPDGTHLATADEAGWIKIWNLTTYKSVWEQQGRNQAGVHFSSDGQRFGFSIGTLNWSSNSMGQVIEWPTGKPVLQVTNGDFEAFSPDGRLGFFTRSLDIGTELRDLLTGKVVKTVPGLNGSLTVSPDGRYFATLWRGFGIYLAHLASDRPSSLLRSTGPLGTALAFSPDNTVLANGGQDQVIRLWNVAEGQEAGRLLGHLDSITDLAYSPDGSLLASASMDHTIQLWPTNQTVAATIISNTWPPYLLSPDGTKLVASVENGLGRQTQPRVWDIATRQPLPLPGMTARVVAESFSPDSQTLHARGDIQLDGKLPLLSWNLNRPEQPPQTNWLQLKLTNQVESSAITGDGKIYAIGQGGHVSYWNLPAGQLMGNTGHATNLYVGSPYRFSPDGQTLAIYAPWNYIRLVNLQRPDRIFPLELPTLRILESAFSPDGKILAVAGHDHCIYLVEAATATTVGILRGHQQSVTAVVFSPDGKTLASSGAGGVIKLWSWPARREAATIIQGIHDYCFLAFTPDGNSLIAGGWDRTQIFRVPTLTEIDQPKSATQK